MPVDERVAWNVGRVLECASLSNTSLVETSLLVSLSIASWFLPSLRVASKLYLYLNLNAKFSRYVVANTRHHFAIRRRVCGCIRFHTR